MKILSKKEQLEARQEELFKLGQFQDHQARLIEEKRNKIRDSWFGQKWKADYMTSVLSDARKVQMALSEYNQDLRSRAKQESPEFKQDLITYILDFAALYGEYYHNKDADKILEKVSEKMVLPEEFLSRAGII